MIAPIKEEDRPVRSLAVSRAHRLIAATFFRHPSRRGGSAPRMPLWKAWALAAWTVVVVAAYVALMIGWL